MPGRLVVVGDPKQAIYAFRGADIDTYTRALAGFKESDPPLGHVFELTTNFRSVAPLIEWVNRVFAAAMHGQPAQVAYRDLDVRHRPDSREPRALRDRPPGSRAATQRGRIAGDRRSRLHRVSSHG